MKRLIKKSNNTDNNFYDNLRNEVMIDINNENNTGMLLLNELDSVDVKCDKCPQCKNKNLVNKDGFKVCPSCGIIYKILDGEVYAVTE